MSSFAPADPLNWLVFVELPEEEANAPLYAALMRSVIVLLAGLLLACLTAVLLARRMAVPIQALTSGAARIGTGALDHRIEIKTGDELEELGEQFNHMASQLQGSYATLERKVDERTQQLQLANLCQVAIPRRSQPRPAPAAPRAEPVRGPTPVRNASRRSEVVSWRGSKRPSTT